MEVQVGESLLELLKMCSTPVEPPPPLPDLRKFSSDMSETLSPQRRLSVVDVRAGHSGDALLSALSAQAGEGGANAPGGADNGVERDFFAHLYSGDMTALESGAVPEDYYNYLESWYCAQKGLQSPASSTKSATSGAGGQSAVTSQPSIYIPVDALQNLRASMPALVTCAAASSTSSVSRSTNSLGKSPGQSFFSSVISMRPFAGGSGSQSGSSLGPPSIGGSGTGGHAGRIMSKKLWRTRSKSRGRSSVIMAPPWNHQVNNTNHLSRHMNSFLPNNFMNMI